MGSLIPFRHSTQLALRRPLPLTTATRQLDLVLDDARLRGMKSTERHAALQALAQLLLEAADATVREAGDDLE